VGPLESIEQAEKAADAYRKDILKGLSPISAMSNNFSLKTFSVK
jgi:hypothetical protein